MLGAQLDRCERVLDLVGDLMRHLAPGLEPVGAFELAPLRIQLDRHLVEVRLQDLQLVRHLVGHPFLQHLRAPRRHRRVELTARDTARRARQSFDGVRDAASNGPPDEPDHRGEEQRGPPDPSVQLDDLGLDLQLSRSQRHRQDHISPNCRDRDSRQLIPR